MAFLEKKAFFDQAGLAASALLSGKMFVNSPLFI